MRPLHTVEAMRRVAQRRLPRFAFDFLDGGAGRESCLGLNTAAFDSIRLWPRVLTGTTDRSAAMQLLGQHYAAPIGIAPIGLANLVRPGTDLSLARAATRTGIAYVLSTAATTAIEQIAAVCPNCWFQLYVGRDSDLVHDLIERANVAELPVLVVTADTPVPARRPRDLHNGFSWPLRPSMRMAADLISHPTWLLRMLSGGLPRFANLERHAGSATSTNALARLMTRQHSAHLDWRVLETIRERWPRKLVLKGVLHPEDALHAARLGVDAVIVSNHGGRQFDAAPASLEALPLVRNAVGPSFKLIFDGGVRSGDDIARALGLGADFVLLGRPFLYAVAALGLERGPEQLIGLLTDEFDQALAQLGSAAADQLFEKHFALTPERDPHQLRS